MATTSLVRSDLPPTRREQRVKGKGRRTPNNRRLQMVRADIEQRRSIRPIEHSSDAEVSKEIVDTALSALRLSQAMVDNLQPEDYWDWTIDHGRIECAEIRARNDYLEKLDRIINNRIKNGLDERSIVIQEARAVMMISMVAQAMERAGLSREQIAAVGHNLGEIAREQKALTV